MHTSEKIQSEQNSGMKANHVQDKDEPAPYGHHVSIENTFNSEQIQSERRMQQNKRAN
jgi:hypothetical protein